MEQFDTPKLLEPNLRVSERARMAFEEFGPEGAFFWLVAQANALGHDISELGRALLPLGAQPNSENRRGMSPLMEAAHEGDSKLVEALFEFCDPCFVGKKSQYTALGAATHGASLECVRMLLPLSNPNHPDDANFTPLMLTAIFGGSTMTAIARVLLPLTDIEFACPRNGTALDLAVRRGARSKDIAAILRQEAARRLALAEAADIASVAQDASPRPSAPSL